MATRGVTTALRALVWANMTSKTTFPSDPPLGPAPSAAPGAAWVAPEPVVRPLPDRMAARAVALALAGGLLAQLLFFGQLPGINVPLWIAFVLAAAVAVRPADARLDRRDAWLPVAALTFAAFFGLREDAMLLAFDALAAGSLTLAAVVALGGRSVSRSSWSAICALGARAIAIYFVGAPYVGRGLRPIVGLFGGRSDGTAWRVARGLLLALPLVLVFVVLFAAADAVFENALRNVLVLDLDTRELWGRLVLGLLAAWLLAGTMVAAWLSPLRQSATSATTAEAPARSHIGSIEGIVVLATLDVLFAVFVVLQAAYLFGGLDTLGVGGMTYSDYARRGFFELVVVALLAGIVLVVLGALVAPRGRVHRIAAALLAGLTGVILVSALYRLGLYQQAYGWTELRFYTVAAIGWLGVGVIAAIAAVVVDRVSVLPKAMLAAGLLVAVGCNLIGPQSFVTQQNVARALDPTMVAPGGFSGIDVEYLAHFDADGVRILAHNVSALPAPERDVVDRVLGRARARLSDAADAGWPSWSLSRQQALEALTAAGY